MENKKMVIDTNLGMIKYLQTVNDIVLEYFDENGKYQPHIGILNVMRLFYNLCVKESRFDEQIKHEIIDATEMIDIVSDKEFINEFNNCLCDSTGIAMNFSNAYIKAMDIVENKKSSLENMLTLINKAVVDILNSFNEAMNDEVLEKLVNIADKMSKGNINAGSIVEAYVQSERFHEVVNSDTSKEENVVE